MDKMNYNKYIKIFLRVLRSRTTINNRLLYDCVTETYHFSETKGRQVMTE